MNYDCEFPKHRAHLSAQGVRQWKPGYDMGTHGLFTSIRQSFATCSDRAGLSTYSHGNCMMHFPEVRRVQHNFNWGCWSPFAMIEVELSYGAIFTYFLMCILFYSFAGLDYVPELCTLERSFYHPRWISWGAPFLVFLVINGAVGGQRKREGTLWKIWNLRPVHTCSFRTPGLTAALVGILREKVILPSLI